MNCLEWILGGELGLKKCDHYEFLHYDCHKFCSHVFPPQGTDPFICLPLVCNDIMSWSLPSWWTAIYSWLLTADLPGSPSLWLTLPSGPQVGAVEDKVWPVLTTVKKLPNIGWASWVDLMAEGSALPSAVRPLWLHSVLRCFPSRISYWLILLEHLNLTSPLPISYDFTSLIISCTHDDASIIRICCVHCLNYQRKMCL